MSTYCVGDLHGCYDELILLLKKVKFDPKVDFLLTTGDVIGRGPKPVEVLNFLLKYQDRITSVLGNHDLSLLRNYHLYTELKDQTQKENYLNNLKATELKKILQEKNGIEMLSYLRHCPMTFWDHSHNLFLSHAGLSPEWNIHEAVINGNHVESALRSDHFGMLMENMFSDRQNKWKPIQEQFKKYIKHDHLKGKKKDRQNFDYDDGDYDFFSLSPSLELDRCIYTINALTRMRFCFNDLSLDFACKDRPKDHKDHDLKPWFEYKNPQFKKSQTLIFGHWAALEGVDPADNIIALDTGCVWKGSLSLIDINEPKKRFTMKSLY